METTLPRASLNREQSNGAEVGQGAERKSNGDGVGPSRCETPEGGSLPGWSWSGVLAAAAGHQAPERVRKARRVQVVRQGRTLSLPGPLQWRPPRVRSTGTLILPISLKTRVRTGCLQLSLGRQAFTYRIRHHRPSIQKSGVISDSAFPNSKELGTIVCREGARGVGPRRQRVVAEARGRLRAEEWARRRQVGRGAAWDSRGTGCR